MSKNKLPKILSSNFVSPPKPSKWNIPMSDPRMYGKSYRPRNDYGELLPQLVETDWDKQQLTRETLHKLVNTVKERAQGLGVDTSGLSLTLYLPLPVSSALGINQGDTVNGVQCIIYKEHGDILCSYGEIVHENGSERITTPAEFLVHRGLTPI